jgi:hypothetical protein
VPKSSEISYAYRNVIIAYYFQMGIEPKEISDRLKVEEAAVSEFISTVKELVLNHESESITAIVAAHAAAEPKT